MNRRELFQQLAGIAAVGGAGIADFEIVSADTMPAIAVFTTPAGISDETAKRLANAFNNAVKDTAFADVKVFVLSDGMRATFFDGNGRSCNQRVSAYLDALEKTKSHEWAETRVELDESGGKFR